MARFVQFRFPRRIDECSPGVCAISRARTATEVRPLNGWPSLEEPHFTFSQCRWLIVLRCATNLRDNSRWDLLGSGISSFKTTEHRCTHRTCADKNTHRAFPVST